MKKKTLNSVFDTLFWGFLLILPLVMLIIVNVQFKYFLNRVEVPLMTSDGTQIEEMYHVSNRLNEYGITYEVFARLGLGSYSDFVGTDYWAWLSETPNPVFKLFKDFTAHANDVFAPFNISIDSSNFWAFYFTWFVFIELMHLFIDVILFIPRACKKLLGRWSYE